MNANDVPMPHTPVGFPPTPGFTEIGGQYQHIGQGGTGSQTQQNGPTANGNATMNLAGYNENMMRERAAANVAAGPSLKMSARTGILQSDGVTIADTGLLSGDDGSVVLSSEVMIQIDHFKVHKLWQSWLRKYGLSSTQQVGAASTVDGLERLFFSAQRSENLILSISDQANIRLFQATCINMKDMADAPECSAKHAAMLKGLRSKLDCVYLLQHAINPSMDGILEPNLALKLAEELRREKPMISIYPLTRMKTAADANDGLPKDESVVLVDGVLKKKDQGKVKLHDLNEIFQRMLVFITTLDWACGGHTVKDFWSPQTAQTVKQTLQRLVWQKFGDKNQSIGHVINCWKQTNIFLAERLQNGETLSQAWSNSAWGLKWSMLHHTDWSLDGEKVVKEKKGEKRGADSADKEPNADSSWQSKHDAMRAKYQKLLGGKKGGKTYGE